MEYKFKLTVFTPTYNRAHLLDRAFLSVNRQNFKDIEWLIVDDGSTDGTKELIECFSNRANFPVVYLRQENRGRHIAINTALKHARGSFFMILDSDDWLIEDALRIALDKWETIPLEERDQFSGLCGRRIPATADPSEARFPADRFISDYVEIKTIHGFTGETVSLTRTELRRQYPFPDFGETYCPPSLVWNRIAKSYRTLFINDTLQFLEYQTSGLTKNGRLKLIKSPNGVRIRDIELAQNRWNRIPLSVRHQSMAGYVRNSLNAGVSLVRQNAEVDNRLLWLRCILRGLRGHSRDKRLSRKHIDAAERKP